MHKKMPWVMGLFSAVLLAAAACGGVGLDGDEGHAAESHAAACDPAALPAPAGGGVMVQFVNHSGAEMILEQTDAAGASQHREVARLADGEAHNQETAAGQAWVMREVAEGHEGSTLEYVATAEERQCAVFQHWGYEGAAAADNWAELREEYETCAVGLQQSPIDLGAAVPADLQEIAFDYGQTAVDILNNGHTIQVDAAGGGRIEYAGQSYELRQFHFHAPSEHTVGGQHYPLEMHLVHQSAGGQLAVVGVFIDEGAENAAYAPVWAHLPPEETAAVRTGATAELEALLPDGRAYFHYRGSLTTPPCSEAVEWLVLQEPVALSAAQIAAFTAIFDGNNRPLQPLNERDPQLDSSP